MRLKGAGFTLMELCMVMAAIGAMAVVATVAVTGSIGTFKFSAATSKVINDLRYAQHMARTHNAWYGINFSADPTNSYTLYLTDGVNDTTQNDPANMANPFTIQVAQDYGAVTISAVNIAGGTKVEFSPMGVPYNDMNGTALAAAGTITLSNGGTNRVIQILSTTGRVELQ